MPKLTMKQKLFVQEYIKTKGNGTQAVLRVYDTKNPRTATVIGVENLSKPSVKEELERALKESKIDMTRLTTKMSDVLSANPAKGYSGSDIVSTIQTGLKLHGVLTDRKTVTSYSMNIDYKDLSTHELIQLRNKKQQETDAILADDNL